MPAYLARPRFAGEYPGVLVVHELFGFNPSIRTVADRLAGEGYTALVVDLFAGHHPVLNLARAIAGVAFSPLDNRLLRDVQHALGVLREMAEVDGAQLATVGFSMGASYALQLACVSPRLRAAGVFYGQNPRPLAALGRACPIVASFAARDLTTAGQARKLEQALRAFGVPRDVKVYRRAGHGFCRVGDRSYQPDAAEDAWRRTLAFFRRHLER